MEQKTLKIGVDVDGVLADFVGAARKVCQQLFNGRPDNKAIQSGWGFDSLGIAHDEERQMWGTIDASKNWWLNEVRALPNTHLLSKLSKVHQLIFITNRKQGNGFPVEEQTARWLWRDFGIYYPTVLLSGDKGPLAKALKLDYFIDDREKNLKEVIASIGPEKVVGLKATYTPEEFFKSHPNWVNNFNEFAGTILGA